MSQIGSSVNQVPLAAPAAAISGQIRSAESNQRQAEAGDRSFQVSRDRQLDQTVNDVGDPGQSDDRDADGRMMWSGQGGSTPVLKRLATHRTRRPDRAPRTRSKSADCSSTSTPDTPPGAASGGILSAARAQKAEQPLTGLPGVGLGVV